MKRSVVTLLAASVCVAIGCGDGTTGSSSGTTTAAGGDLASGGSGGSANGGSAAGGTIGVGGGSGGSGGPCNSGDTQACYSGDPATLGVGSCVEGSQVCDDGAWGPCNGEVLATAEVCNGADDDCNGFDDDAGIVTCGDGACQLSVPACSNGADNTCTPLGAAVSETCGDGIDDDCNGAVDDTCPCTDGATQACYTGPLATQNVGACKNGMQLCVAGAWGACGGDATPEGEICDGHDNDCNGAIDESCGCSDGTTQQCFSGPVGSANVGPCIMGTQTCTNGLWEACSGDIAPVAELCDSIDNDCNGGIDDGNPGGGAFCATGASGECAAGTTTCQNGSVSCKQDVPLSAEKCDLLDNDCDGSVDEGNPQANMPCMTGQPGVCAPGSTTCSNGALLCNPLQPAGSELCNGLDDDCDGTSDDGNPGGGVACNTGLPGLCNPGTTACTNGAIMCQPNATVMAEICDGIDNDCNGSIDDGNPGGGQMCSTGSPGPCAAGTTACFQGSVQCQPNVQPSPEICDGIDNNCNGGIDDGNPGGGAVCNTGIPGLCADGISQCQGGSVVCVTTVQPGTEICDGLDNDCDGAVDDGNPGGGATCSTGLLGTCGVGATACMNGAISCQQINMPGVETCDGTDQDCNGVIDNGNPGGGQMCSTGQPGICAPGTTVCQGGAIQCTPNTAAQAEVCDGLDNDCDGVSDEGNPGGGQWCWTGNLGMCSNGTTACQAGGIVCNQDVSAGAEICDGLDNDCDGMIDDGNPGGGAACNTGLSGVCAAGTLTCQNGSIVCSQNVLGNPEICGNGLDDNCDGVTDEDNDFDGDGWGACNNDCCDLAGFCSNTPALINPGALEVLNDGIDNDCDLATSDTIAAPLCSSAADFAGVTPNQLAQAMDICQTTTANPPLPQKKWGLINASFRLANGSNPSAAQLGNMQNWQSAVLQNYGTNVAPQVGATMAGLSSGRMRDQNDPNYVNPNIGTPFGSGSTPPAAYLAAHGGALPASQGCSGNCPSGSGANDSVNLRLQIRVPTNAQSFAYQFRYFTSEYWCWSCTAFNDFYLALLTSAAAGLPADRNISFDSLNNPVSVNNGFFDICQGKGCYLCPLGTPSTQLPGTGMQLPDNGAVFGCPATAAGGQTGGGTVWLQTTSPVVPGETMVIELMVFDVSDDYLDSLVLLDAFSWSVDPAVVGTGPAD